jgi:hypothetical protein
LVFKICYVLGPSSDYYARHGDSDKNDIMMWIFDSEHDSEEEAIEEISAFDKGVKF